MSFNIYIAFLITTTLNGLFLNMAINLNNTFIHIFRCLYFKDKCNFSELYNLIAFFITF
jgi:hypothetical protein